MPLDLGVAYQSVRQLATAFIASLPRIVAALVVIGLGFLAARGVRWGAERAVRQGSRHRNLRIAVGRITFFAALAFAILIGATVAFPSFTIGSLIQLLGVSGVVIGFAFKDIFQNFLAGILLLITDPFEVGDQIVVDSFEGTVEEIKARATLITTYDRRQVIIPNSDMFTKAVTVNTAFERRRMHCDVVVKGSDDPDRVQGIIEQAVRGGIEGVEQDPVATALLISIAGGGLTFRTLWWSNSERGGSLIVQDRVLKALQRALRDQQLTIG
jgi:small-conductance mechanosensitive channel